MDSRRNTYCPPARGYMAASSPYASAPKMVTTPETIHAISSQNGEMTVREISAEKMKIPDPIIEPATSIVASVSVSALTNSRDDGVSVVAVVLVNALPQYSVSSRCFTPVQRAEVTVGDALLLVERGPRIEGCEPTAATERSPQSLVRSPQSAALENEVHVDGVSHRCSISVNPW